MSGRDILNKNDEPIACFSDQNPGEEVLARWSDNKFYSATVDYIGTLDNTLDAKKATMKDMKTRAAVPKRFYSLPPPPRAAQPTSEQHHPSYVQHSIIQPPTAASSPSLQPQYHPISTEKSLSSESCPPTHV